MPVLQQYVELKSWRKHPPFLEDLSSHLHVIKTKKLGTIFCGTIATENVYYSFGKKQDALSNFFFVKILPLFHKK